MVFAIVNEGFQKDYAKSRARVNKKFFDEFDIKPGEIVELISGEKRVPVIIMPLENYQFDESSISQQNDSYINSADFNIFINGFIRKSLKVAIGQQIQLDRTSYQISKSIVVVPLNPNDRARIYSDYLVSRPVLAGQMIELNNELGNDLVVSVVKSDPVGIVIIDTNTEIFISNDTPEELIQTEPLIMYDSIGGFKAIKERFRTLVEYPLRYPELFDNLNITPPRGILLTGAKGSGKTLFSKAVSYEAGVHRFYIMATEIVKGWWESEGEMDKYFQQIKHFQPAVVIIDQIDVLAPLPSPNTTDLERRLTERLINNLDQLDHSKIVLIGTCENSELVHPLIKSYGRFEIEISIPVPTADDRYEILVVLTRGIPLDNVDIQKIVDSTAGFSPADIELLVKEAGLRALERYNISENVFLTNSEYKDSLKKLSISQDDFNHALVNVKPSATREFINQIPKISWDDIGGLDSVKQAIQETIAWPINRPELFKEMGINPPKGILLYGPPGTGKTLVAKAISNQIKANFLSIKGPELLTKWFSESPRMIRDLFKRAKQLAPCIIFFDEIDALAPQRSSGTDTGGSQERDRVINQLLATLDGMDPISGVFVIGATNRPDAIDPAMLRPGRIDRLIYVTIPDLNERLEILKVHTAKMTLSKDVNLQYIAEQTENFTGADLQNVCREAVFAGLRINFATRIIENKYFEEALKICRPSVSKELKEKYDTMSKEIRKKKITEYIESSFEFR